MLITQTIGSATIDALSYIGGLARLAARATRALFMDMFSPRRLAYGRAVHQSVAVGIGALPILSLISYFIGFLGGSVFGIIAAGFTLKTYFIATMDALILRDVVTGLIKSVMFGLVITTVGCQEGLRTGLGAEEVGRSTTSAVVKSIFLVVMVDLVFTALFYLNAKS